MSFLRETEEYFRKIRKEGVLEYWTVEDLFPKKDFISQSFATRFKTTKGVVDALIAANCQNKIGYVDYNEFGGGSELGFQPCLRCGIFVDNIIVYVYAAKKDTRLTEDTQMPESEYKKGKWKFAGPTNTQIRTVFRNADMPVRKVVCTQLQHKETVCIPFAGKKDMQICVKQFFKVSLDNQDLECILKLLESQVLGEHGIPLNDLGATQDMVGSFQKETLISCLLDNGFRMEGDGFYSGPTIMDNDHSVGRNCLTFLQETKNGRRIRAKIYNKMVQMLESFSVRSNGGHHWRDWALQQGTMLAKARDSPGAKERGLTRLESTFYVDGDAPLTKEEIFVEMENLKNLFSPALTLHTSYDSKWTALANHFQHMLVLHDTENDDAYFTYPYNEVTERTLTPLQKISPRIRIGCSDASA